MLRKVYVPKIMQRPRNFLPNLNDHKKISETFFKAYIFKTMILFVIKQH